MAAVLLVPGISISRVYLGVIFPREPLEVALLFRYVRYALIGLWTVWLAPWAFVRLGLAGHGMRTQGASFRS